MVTVFSAITLVLGAASLATGIGLWKMRDWGRTLQIVLACIGLLAIPMGTIISILLLVYFTRPHVKILFSGNRRDQLTPDETAACTAETSPRTITMYLPEQIDRESSRSTAEAFSIASAV